MSKMDLPEAREAFDAFAREMKARGHEALAFSSATREGVENVLLALERVLLGVASAP
jgi:hypothetical protein